MAYQPLDHRGGDFGTYIYPDNYFNDVDDPAAGYDAELVNLECAYYDPTYLGGVWWHVGTYDLDNEHDNLVYRSVIGRPDGVNPAIEFDFEHHGNLVVVHRRRRDC